MRHGEAEPSAGDFPDHLRSLTTRGKGDVADIAAEIARREIVAPCIITSHAFRAIETALIMAGVTGSGHESVVIKEVIYSHLSLNQLHLVLEESAIGHDNIIIVGHNPSLTSLVSHFSKGLWGYMAPASLAAFTLTAHTWSDIDPSCSKAEYLLQP